MNLYYLYILVWDAIEVSIEVVTPMAFDETAVEMFHRAHGTHVDYYKSIPKPPKLCL